MSSNAAKKSHNFFRPSMAERNRMNQLLKKRVWLKSLKKAGKAETICFRSNFLIEISPKPWHFAIIFEVSWVIFFVAFQLETFFSIFKEADFRERNSGPPLMTLRFLSYSCAISSSKDLKMCLVNDLLKDFLVRESRLGSVCWSPVNCISHLPICIRNAPGFSFFPASVLFTRCLLVFTNFGCHIDGYLLGFQWTAEQAALLSASQISVLFFALRWKLLLINLRIA